MRPSHVLPCSLSDALSIAYRIAEPLALCSVDDLRQLKGIGPTIIKLLKKRCEEERFPGAGETCKQARSLHGSDSAMQPLTLSARCSEIPKGFQEGQEDISEEGESD